MAHLQALNISMYNFLLQMAFDIIFSTSTTLIWEIENENVHSKKNGVNFHSIFHWRHSVGSDVSAREWRQWLLLLEWISLSSEFSLYILELELSEIHSTSEIYSLHGWSELFTRFFFKESNQEFLNFLCFLMASSRRF